jgi:hypothetical protein
MGWNNNAEVNIGSFHFSERDLESNVWRARAIGGRSMVSSELLSFAHTPL